MTQLFSNNAVSTLASDVTDVATSMTVGTGDGALFPSPTGGDFFLVTLLKLSGVTESSIEIVKVTQRTGDIFNVVARGQEGTTALAYLTGDRVQARLTAGSMVVKADVAALSPLTAHAGSTSNPHSVTKAQIDLGNVDNTADSAKPVSTAQQTALNAKQDTLVSGSNIKTVNGTSLLGSGNVDTGDVTLSGVQTLANKTLNSPVFNDGYTEEVFAVNGTAPALSPANGSIQTWALSGNSTPTAGSWASGQSITLLVDDGSAYTINWASMSITWKTGGGTAPALLTAGYTSIELAKIGTTIYGWLAGDA